MRHALADAPLELPNGTRIALTASFGIAELVAGQAAEQVLSLADAALYEAKAAGKNRVSRAQQPVFDG
jgi:diguanylate cyclase (GGDEF)-like protein